MNAILLASLVFGQSIAVEATATITNDCDTPMGVVAGDTIHFRAYGTLVGDFYEGNGLVEYPGGVAVGFLSADGGGYTVPQFPNGSLVDYFGFTADGFSAMHLVTVPPGERAIVCRHQFTPPVVAELLPGDANRDGLFNTTDMILALASGKYESGDVAGWADGDWNADARFDSGDLVVALATGAYEQPTVAAVPEPSGWLLACVAAAALKCRPVRRADALDAR